MSEQKVVGVWYNGLGPALTVLDIEHNSGEVTVKWTDAEEPFTVELQYETDEDARAYIEVHEARWYFDECIRTGTPWS